MYNLDMMLVTAGEMAEMWLVKLHRSSLMPTWELHNGEDQIYIVGTPWGNPKEKLKAEKVLRQKMKELGIVAYSFLCEAFMTKEFSKEEIASGRFVMPSKNPNRIEVVVALATDGKICKWRQWRTGCLVCSIAGLPVRPLFQAEEQRPRPAAAGDEACHCRQ